MMNTRTQTADIVRKALNGGGHAATDVTEAIVTTLAEKRLIYRHRENNVRAAIRGAFKERPDNRPTQAENLSERIYENLIASGEIVSSWLY